MVRKTRLKKTDGTLTHGMGSSGHFAIAATLGMEILSGARQPGSRLPSVEEMFKTFGVSRVVVREVARTLAAKGMVTSKTRVGTLVLDATHWNWLDPQVLEWRGNIGFDQDFLSQLTEVRLAVEPAAAGLAARKRTKQDLAVMRIALDRMLQAEGNHHKFSEADRAFHAAISAATHNPLFRSFTAATEVVLVSFLRMIAVGIVADEKTHARSAARHAKILDAIVARDEQAATRAMVQVIDEGLKHAQTGIGRRKS